MNFFFLTNYLNYVKFDEAIALLDCFKKSIAKSRKGATL